MTWTLHLGDCLDPVTGLASLGDNYGHRVAVVFVVYPWLLFVAGLLLGRGC